ncbi:hypothetical protein [Arthrobacter rhombi]|uniref:hypothetical protein n=1 Tax=Arthrobacter rhombi TaxID=71253 RepID=UPI003FD1EE84
MSKSSKATKSGDADEGKATGQSGAGDPGAEQTGGENPGGDTTDWKAEARKWEGRSKENKTALDSLTARLDALETSNGELSQKLTAQESKAERDALVERIATAAGVPAGALRGATEDELTAHAETLKEMLPSAPVIEGQGDTPANPGSDELLEFTRNLFDNAED